MNLLVDENIPRSDAQVLAAAGHDGRAVRTVARGTTDAEVVQLGMLKRRIIVKADKDVAAFAVRLPGGRVCSPQRPWPYCRPAFRSPRGYPSARAHPVGASFPSNASCAGTRVSDSLKSAYTPPTMDIRMPAPYSRTDGKDQKSR